MFESGGGGGGGGSVRGRRRGVGGNNNIGKEWGRGGGSLSEAPGLEPNRCRGNHLCFQLLPSYER